MSKHKLLELTSKDSLEQIIAEDSKEDDSVEIAKMFQTRMIAIGSGESNICFMDMRGEKVLSPEDSKQFEFLIFGGILGDHPPQDRVKDLRSNFANIRQLGTVQMTTDTALLVSREILEEGKPITSLKFVENPEIPTDDSVKRYLDMAFPIATLASEKFKG
jgi:ribosome biogenesis SPOUT family RNA methylase Rps3